MKLSFKLEALGDMTLEEFDRLFKAVESAVPGLRLRVRVQSAKSVSHWQYNRKAADAISE